MCPQQGSETSQETEHLVWTTWCFGSVATIQQPQVRNNADRWLLHSFQWLICQIYIWCGEPSPAECTDMTTGTTSCESVSTVKYIWEHIRGGWAWIVMSLYYTFSENTVSHKSKMTRLRCIISAHCGCFLPYARLEKEKRVGTRLVIWKKSYFSFT